MRRQSFVVARSVPPAPPDRDWIYLEDDPNISAVDSFTILSYNVLCEKYAPASSYMYCPSWALSWEFRKDLIVNEIVSYNADVICLQEIELGQFEEYFQPQLRANGEYEGSFFPKSRARTMSEAEKRSVDGCATFWKSSKFSLIEKHLIEFQRIPMERPEFRKSDDMFNRVTLRDNVAVITFLENKETKSRVLIANGGLAVPTVENGDLTLRGFVSPSALGSFLPRCEAGADFHAYG